MSIKQINEAITSQLKQMTKVQISDKKSNISIKKLLMMKS
jgi:hypothetical protein